MSRFNHHPPVSRERRDFREEAESVIHDITRLPIIKGDRDQTLTLVKETFSKINKKIFFGLKDDHKSCRSIKKLLREQLFTEGKKE